MNLTTHLMICMVIMPALFGCAASEPYQKPKIATPDAWHSNLDEKLARQADSSRHSFSDGGSSKIVGWWESLQDDTLNELLKRAVENNNNLQIAKARIAEAKALRGESLSKLFPDISATGSASREGNQSSRGGSDALNNAWEAGINGSWEIDIFGGRRAELEAGDAGTFRAEAQYRQALLILLSDVGRSYTDMRALERLLQLTQKNLQLQQETLRATRLQHKAQAVSKLDVLRAEAQVQTTEAKIPSVHSSLAATRHRLAVLVGESPGAIDEILDKVRNIPSFNTAVVLDTPVSVIAARPDVQAAEYALMEAAALKNSASAELFPKLTLSGFLGVGDASLFGAANPWSLGANALLPLLNFGKIESRIDAADARKTQTFHAYKQTVLTALEEVENALVLYGSETARQKSLSQAAENYQEAARLARIKYEAGDASFLDVLIAEERLLDAQTDATLSSANTAKAAIALHTALGMANTQPFTQGDSHD